MQQCPECGSVYDESEYAKCPYCRSGRNNNNDDYDVIVYDHEEGKAKVVPKSEAHLYR